MRTRHAPSVFLEKFWFVRSVMGTHAKKKKTHRTGGYRRHVTKSLSLPAKLPLCPLHDNTHLPTWLPSYYPWPYTIPPPPPHFLSFSIKIWKINSFLEFNYYFSFLYFKKSILISILLILVSLFSKCVIAHSTWFIVVLNFWKMSFWSLKNENVGTKMVNF